jgi:hypothetical protein
LHYIEPVDFHVQLWGIFHKAIEDSGFVAGQSHNDKNICDNNLQNGID